MSTTQPFSERLLAIYSWAFTACSIPVVVQFYLKRRTYFLKERLPHLALLQLVLCQFEWITPLIVKRLGVSPQSTCVLLLVLQEGVGRLFVEVLSLRVWLLFRRTYLSSMAARRLNRLRTIQGTSRMSLSKIKGLVQRLSWRLVAVKYVVPAIFALIVCLHLASFVAPLSGGSCTRDAATAWSHSLRSATFALASLFFLGVVWRVRHTHDNFHLAREFRQDGVIIALAVVLATVAQAVAAPAVGADICAVVMMLTAHGLFLTAGVVPLREQRNLERKIAAGNLGRLNAEMFDDMLEGKDPAALVLFETFMKKEFCEEMIEFYNAVTHYKRMYAMWTQDTQRAQANIIYASYIDESAASQINISAESMQRIRDTLYADVLPSGGSGANTTCSAAAAHLKDAKRNSDIDSAENSAKSDSDSLRHEARSDAKDSANAQEEPVMCSLKSDMDGTSRGSKDRMSARSVRKSLARSISHVQSMSKSKPWTKEDLPKRGAGKSIARKRSEVLSRSTIQKAPPENLFDEAQREMHKLMKEGPFQRFMLRHQARTGKFAKKRGKYGAAQKPKRKKGKAKSKTSVVVGG